MRDTRRPARRFSGASIALSAYEQARAQPALEFVFYRPVRWLLRLSWRTPYYLVTRKPFRRYEIYSECHDSQPWLVRKLEARFVRLYARSLALDTPVGPIWLARKLRGPEGVSAPGICTALYVEVPFGDEYVDGELGAGGAPGDSRARGRW